MPWKLENSDLLLGVGGSFLTTGQVEGVSTEQKKPEPLE